MSFYETPFAVWTIRGEAEGEPYNGKCAVGEVIRTRAKLYRQTFIEVIFAPWQFSFWNSDSKRRAEVILQDDPATNPLFLECLKAWIDSEHTNYSGGATHYVNLALVKAPPWAATMEQTAVVGQHTFYKERITNV